MKKCLRLCLHAAAMLSGLNANAQEGSIHMIEPDDSAYTLEVEIYHPPLEIEQDAELALADLANPDIVVIPSGSSVENEISSICPGASDAYIRYVEDKLSKINRNVTGTFIDYHVIVDEPTLVAIPACIGRQFESVFVARGRYPYDAWAEENEINGEVPGRNWAGFSAQLNSVNNLGDNPTFHVGQKILFPPPVATFLVPKVKVFALVDALERTLDPDTVKINYLSETGVSEAEAWTIKEIELDECSPNDLSGALSYVLTMNVNLRESIISSLAQISSPRDVSIAVFDTGLRKFENPLLDQISKKVIPDNHESPSIFQSMEASNLTLCDGADSVLAATHAEQVVGVALGGFVSTIPLGKGPAVRIHSSNIYEGKTLQQLDGSFCAEVAPNARNLEATLKEIVPAGAQIDVVNLSQSWPKDDSTNPLRNITSNSEYPFLVVAAAGNSGKGYDEIPRYPGAFPHDGESRLLVVGAVEDKNTPHPSTSFDSQRVDIAARGCNTPTIEFHRSEIEKDIGLDTASVRMKFVSGTSFAAPQVSFVAAMIKSLAGDKSISADEIKNRLLVSSDINGSLFDKFVDGRVLNPAKALSLYDDIVEMVDGTLIRGKVFINDSDEGQVDICPELMLDMGNVRKVALISGGVNDGRYLIYSELDGVLQTYYCGALSDVSIDASGVHDKSMLLPADAVRDVTFHMYKAS